MITRPILAIAFALTAGLCAAPIGSAQGRGQTPVIASTEQGYRAGVNYHATGADFLSSAFVKTYHKPGVRPTVRAQLQGMADAGASIIKTTLWQVQDVETYADPNENWRLAFPLSPQDLTNISAYARDVAATQAADGHRLSLQITLQWLGCADFHISNDDGTVTWCRYSWADFLALARQSINNALDVLAPVLRPDGVKVLDVVYLIGEAAIGAHPNLDRFLVDLYPDFLARSNALGLNGSLYFIIAGAEEEVFDDGFSDGAYPAINGHRSLFWVYRSTEFMRLNGLPVPPRLDMSFYPSNLAQRRYAEFVGRVLDDIQAVYGSVPIGVSETFYFSDQTLRRELGQAFADAYLTRGQPAFALFWTTPDGGGLGFHHAYPFAFTDYLPHADRVAPVVVAFDVKPRIGNGPQRTVSWAVSDSGGSHLSAVLVRYAPATTTCSVSLWAGCAWSEASVPATSGADIWADTKQIAVNKGSTIVTITVADRDANETSSAAIVVTR